MRSLHIICNVKCSLALFHKNTDQNESNGKVNMDLLLKFHSFLKKKIIMSTYQMPGTIVDAGDKKLNYKVSLFSSSSHSNMKRKRVNKKTKVNKIISS